MRAGLCALAFLAPAAGLAAALPAAAQPVEPFYRDHPISMLVGFGPGGGYDAYTRLLAHHLGRHVPSNPQVIVQNMPGAASLKAVLYLDSGAPTDGSVVAAFNSGLLTESILNADKLQFKFSNVAWLGSISRDLRVCYAWAKNGNQKVRRPQEAHPLQHGRRGAGDRELHERGSAQEPARCRRPSGDRISGKRRGVYRHRARRTGRRLRDLEQRSGTLDR